MAYNPVHYKTWYEKNKKKRRAQSKAYKQNNKEKVKAYVTEYNSRPEVKEQTRKRNAKYREVWRSTIDNICKHYGCMNPHCPLVEYNFHPCELDFHHIDKKKFTIGWASKMTGPAMQKEINKCCILCAICHRRLHHIGPIANLQKCKVDKNLLPILKVTSTN